MPHVSVSAARWVVGLWLGLIVVIGGSVTALHFFTLPRQVPTVWSDPGRWTAVHGLASKCPCSNRVIDHLLLRGPYPGVTERVALVDAKPEQFTALLERGFQVDRVTATELEQRYGLTGAPVLVIRRPDASLAYVGGHAATQAARPNDRPILASVVAGQTVAPYPLFGCAVGRSLQRDVDPLNLKYGDW